MEKRKDQKMERRVLARPFPEKKFPFYLKLPKYIMNSKVLKVAIVFYD
jgi:hypothetical protein